MARKPVCLRTWSCFVNVVVDGGEVGGGVSVKGWSRWVSCVDRRVSYVDRRVSCVDSSVGV